MKAEEAALRNAEERATEMAEKILPLFRELEWQYHDGPVDADKIERSIRQAIDLLRANPADTHGVGSGGILARTDGYGGVFLFFDAGWGFDSDGVNHEAPGLKLRPGSKERFNLLRRRARLGISLRDPANKLDGHS